MSYNCIRIERERTGFKVRATDPKIDEANRKRDRSDGDGPCAPWQDPDVEFFFETKEATLKFIESAMEIALPVDAFTTAFDKLAKEAAEGTPS